MIKIFNLPVQLNNSTPVFRSSQSTYAPFYPQKDSFATNPLDGGLDNAAQIEAAAKSNPRIREIAQRLNIPIKVNENELKKLEKGHLHETRLIAAKMYSSLPAELKKDVNLKQIQDAAKYHDFGKILVPEKILNKEGELTEEEWKIMEQHSELGYELLKGKGLDNRTLELIKYHHQDSNGTGYPAITGYYEHDIDSQLLQLADKYAALTENRSYKPALSREEALEIIYKDVAGGSIMPELYEALEKATI